MDWPGFDADRVVNFSRQKPIESMSPADHVRSWRDSTLDALGRVAHRHSTDVVDRPSLLAEELEQIVEETSSRGATPDQTLSYYLQELRDEGHIQFLGNGKYRLVNRPIDIESSDLSDDEMDAAIRGRLLRLGLVETSTTVGEARRRKGQHRVRVLTLDNYAFRCAICDVADRALLVTSHIVPWSDAPDGRGDLSNIICLCRFHDSLFEAGYWSLTDELAVLKRDELGSDTVRALLPPIVRFRTPLTQRPAAQYLARHREHHGFELRDSVSS